MNEPRGRGLILVMDDEPDVRDIVREALQDLGYLVATARNGAEALEVVERAGAEGRVFELAILDLTIPGDEGGAELLAEIRRRLPNVSAIASSGYSSDPVMAQPRAYGFAAALAKPYKIGELAETVRAALAAGGSQRGVPHGRP